ncbi:MAG: hypothetical protein D6714_01610 [Bacteroidetes bacterium]|nr:MAG: hypothetical protein D6714_01610 [Bacteroidota bacterium]
MEIRFIAHDAIDKTRWDSCIHYSLNGNVFGYKWFLDNISKDWDALVEGNYESVMPLFRRGRALLQPALIREAGIYTTRVPSRPRIQAFLRAIPDHFEALRLDLNHQNYLDPDTGFEIVTQTNYQLLLNRPYDELAANFHPELTEWLECAARQNFSSTTSLRPEDVARFYEKHGTRPRDPHAILRIMYNALHRGMGFASGIYDAKGNLAAADFFLLSHGRLISFLPAQTIAGEKTGALAFAYNMILLTNAGKAAMLDFNGANEWGKRFGAEPKNFPRIQRGRIPEDLPPAGGWRKIWPFNNK